MVKVNGKLLELDNITLEQYLSHSNYDIKKIAAELNGMLILKSEYADTILKDGDTLEIVSFVGGG